MTQIRMATFNVENLHTPIEESADSTDAEDRPTLDERIDVMRPQLRRIDADILCLQEVHAQEPGDGQRELLALDRLVEDTQYADYNRARTETSDGDPYDKRNLVVLSRFPVGETIEIEQEIGEGAPEPKYRPVTPESPPEQAEPIRWERPILHVKLEVGDELLHVLNVHLKSKIPTDIESQQDDDDPYRWLSAAAWAEGSFISTMKRVGQALQLRQTIDGIFDDYDDQDRDPMIAACGDFNAGLGSVPLKAIEGPRAEIDNPALAGRVLVPAGQSIPKSARYTLLHHGKGEFIDHILLSRALLEYYDTAEIHNEILADESLPFRSDRLFPESDHAPLIAEFEMPGV